MKQTEINVAITSDFDDRGFHNVLEWIMVILFPFSTLAVYGYCFMNIPVWTYWFVVPLILLSLFISDILTGFVHWLADLYGSPTTPLVGPNFIEPFRWHHIEPTAMCKHNLAVTIGNSCLFAVPLQVLLIICMAYYSDSPLFNLSSLVLNTIFIATVLTNQFHKWAHSSPDDRSTIAHYLQKWNLILAPDHHQEHHTPPHTSSYCVTNGWANPLLNKIGFWKKMQWVLSYLGINPDKSSHI